PCRHRGTARRRVDVGAGGERTRRGLRPVHVRAVPAGLSRRAGVDRCQAAIRAMVGRRFTQRPGARRLIPAVGGIRRHVVAWSGMSDLSELARRHLWMHFTRLGAYADAEVPVISRGEGCYVWDQHGKRYLDGLSGLFTVQAGHGRAELGQAAARQAETLGFFPVWSFAHEPAIELATRLAALAPGDLNRVFLTPSGGEAIDTTIKLVRQYFKLIGQPSRTKVISRFLAYHGTSIGALSVTGVPSIKTPFEPLMPGAIKVQTPYRYRCPDCQHLDACTLRCADDVALRIEMEGPDSVAAVFMEPLQNTGGAFAPPEGYWARIREICDQYGVLLVSDEVICAFGRLGHMFGSDRYGYQPDLITFAKGVTSGYAPLGGVLISDRV